MALKSGLMMTGGPMLGSPLKATPSPHPILPTPRHSTVPTDGEGGPTGLPWGGPFYTTFQMWPEDTAADP